MTATIRLFATLGRHGRLLLVAGLLAGFLLPGTAFQLRPWLPEMIAALMFVAAMRIGARQAFGSLRGLPVTLGLVLLLQVGLPVALGLGVSVAGLGATTAAAAVVLVTAAPPLAGSPNLAILTGGDPAPALRLLIVGTALLPLSVLPVFALAGLLEGSAAVLSASSKLLAVIVVATSAGFLLRRVALPRPDGEAIAALDGLSALLMAVVVVGLMAGATEALLTTPGVFLAWLALAFAVNLGLQVTGALALRRSPLADQTLPVSIVAGNRNIALFLVALPAEVTEPLLLFIACYQIPMYLTPLLMRGIHARMGTAGAR